MAAPSKGIFGSYSNPMQTSDLVAGGNFPDMNNQYVSLGNAGTKDYTQDQINKAFTEQMAAGGFKSASDVGWDDYSHKIYQAASSKLGISGKQYLDAMGNWTTSTAGAGRQPATPQTTTPNAASGGTPEFVGSGETPAASTKDGFTWDGNSWVKSSAGGGVISGAAPAQTPAVERYTAQGVQTTPEMTIEGRLKNLLDPNDPRNQQIATSMKEQANARGVLNSSMGDTMIQDGIIKNAVSIAQPDAAMTANNAQFTAGAGNQAGQFNANAQNQMGLQAQQIQAAKDAAATNQGYVSQNMAQSQLYTQANMASQNGFDLSKMTAQEQADLKKMGAAFGYNLQLADQGQKAEIAKMSVAQDYLRNNMALGNSFDIAKMDKSAAITLAQMDAQQLNTVATLAIKQGYDVANLTSAQATQLAAAGINASAQTQAAAMAADARRALQMDQNDFTTLTNGSNNALSIVGKLQSDIAAIQRDPNITDGAAKDKMVASAVNTTRAAMSVISHSTNDPTFNTLMDNLFP